MPPPPAVASATFIAEARTPESVPPVGPPEIAISGRSNVGKSTLLNRLAARRALARTSKTPGRTRGIIFYDLKLAGGPVAELRFADMPGYGYAQVSQAERASWQPLIEGYSERRHTLALFAVLVDSRRGLQSEETQLLEWLTAIGVPTQLVFTKVDKLSVRERAQLLKGPEPRGGGGSGRAGTGRGDAARPGFRAAAHAPALLVSAESGEGVPELWQIMLRAIAAQQAATVGDVADHNVPA